jgi:hypothetical protein
MAGLLWPARGLPLPLLLLTVVCCTAVYLFLCFLLGALQRHEVRRLYEALTSLKHFQARPGRGQPSISVGVAKPITHAC